MKRLHWQINRSFCIWSHMRYTSLSFNLLSSRCESSWEGQLGPGWWSLLASVEKKTAIKGGKRKVRIHFRVGSLYSFPWDLKEVEKANQVLGDYQTARGWQYWIKHKWGKENCHWEREKIKEQVRFRWSELMHRELVKMLIRWKVGVRGRATGRWWGLGGGLVARGGGLVGNGLEEEDSGEEQPPLVYLRFLAANAHILSDAQLI